MQYKIPEYSRLSFYNWIDNQIYFSLRFSLLRINPVKPKLDSALFDSNFNDIESNYISNSNGKI